MTTLFLTVAEQSLQLSAIILCLWGLRAIFRKIPGSAWYLLWILIFIGLLFPLRVEIPYHTEAPAWIPAAAEFSPDADAVPESPEAAVPPSSSQAEPVAPQNSRPRPDLVSLAAITWAAVAAILIGVNGRKLIAFTRRLSGAREIAPGVYETDCVEVPLVLGYLHPRIYLPSFLQPEEREYILLHEQIHLRRRDYLIKPAVYVITLLHWFNPLVWLAYHLLSEDMERACDEAVLRQMGSGIRKEYSMSLLTLSTGRSSSLPTVAFGERGIQYRVMNILHYKKAGGLTLALLILLFCAVACGTFTEPVEVPETPQEEPASPEDFQDDALYQALGVSTESVTTYFEAFQQAAAAGEQETVANLFRYPKQLQLPGEDVTYVNSAEEFLPYYDQIFTPEFLEVIAQIDPADFTQEGPAIGWGEGAVWARVYDGEVTMASVFASRQDRYLAYYEGNDNALSDADAMYQVNGIRQEEAQAFAENFVSLAQADDREAVASMIRYPRTLVVNGSESTLENAEDFLAYYEEILPESFIEHLDSLLSEPLSYRYDGTFLGDGALWMRRADGELLVESLFPSDSVQMKPTEALTVGVEPGTEP